MSHIIPFPNARSCPPPEARRYEVFAIEDDSLSSLGIYFGDEFIVVVGEFNAGDYHVVEECGHAEVRRLCSEIPGTVGWVQPPVTPVSAARSAS